VRQCDILMEWRTRQPYGSVTRCPKWRWKRRPRLEVVLETPAYDLTVFKVTFRQTDAEGVYQRPARPPLRSRCTQHPGSLTLALIPPLVFYAVFSRQQFARIDRRCRQSLDSMARPGGAGRSRDRRGADRHLLEFRPVCRRAKRPPSGTVRSPAWPTTIMRVSGTNSPTRRACLAGRQALRNDLVERVSVPRLAGDNPTLGSCRSGPACCS
jgi:hypothetical protein